MGCIYDEPLEPYWCEADWNCKDCPNWIDEKEQKESEGQGMTREEAIRYLDVYSSTNGSGLCTDKQHYEAKQMAIKALEQESTYYPPCTDCNKKMDEIRRAYDKLKEQEPYDDCISRENTLKAMIEQLGIRNEDYLIPAEATLYKVVKNMPPVTPQPKTGHWIANKAKNYPGWVHCSECGEDWTHLGRPPYCPACGAKMIEEE